MVTRHLSQLSLVLLFGIIACGKDGGTSGGSTANPIDTDTGGLSMSSDPTMGGGTTTGATTSAATSVTTSVATSVTTVGTGDSTTDATGGSSTGGPPVCQIEQPRPGSCNGKVVPEARPLAAARLPIAGGARPLKVAEGDDVLFGSTGCSFVCEPDMGPANECDVFAQDCGPGEKCNAWANDGGGSWNASKCVPVDPNPDQIGESCTTNGGLDGIDSCAKGSMCLGAEGETKCVEQCSCSIDNPVCTTPNTTCTVSNQDVLALCLPVCDPLDLGACSPGDVCLSDGSSEFFFCVVDASGDGGALGDGCQFLNVCNPGLFCSGGFPGCNDIGCCAPYCDLDAPACPQGLACAPWYEPGTAPQCFEDVGACG